MPTQLIWVLVVDGILSIFIVAGQFGTPNPAPIGIAIGAISLAGTVTYSLLMGRFRAAVVKAMIVHNTVMSGLLLMGAAVTLLVIPQMPWIFLIEIFMTIPFIVCMLILIFSKTVKTYRNEN